MRLILPVLAVVFGFATADFVIYTFEDSNFTGEAYVGWKFFDGPPDCNDVCGTSNLSGTDDASDSGVRCEGNDPAGGCAYWDSVITELEVHTLNGMHWTIYEDKGFEMEAADGSGSQGKCTPDTTDDYDCASCGSRSRGRRVFSCKSNFTAKDFGLQTN